MARRHKKGMSTVGYFKKKSTANKKARTLRKKDCPARVTKVSKEMGKKHSGANYKVVKSGPCR